MRKPSYDELPLMPYVVAERVTETPYIGDEVSGGQRPTFVSRVESDRQRMTLEDRRAFAAWVDSRCREAYEADADWFVNCVRSKTNRGRDQLYVWITHWLAAYLGERGGYCA